MNSLTKKELQYLKRKLQRDPNAVETEIVSAEWSEHCSYKSSRQFIKLLPTKGKRVIYGPGYDAGVLDVGDGYVITVHIESHNHPSAVDPYGGAATGVGGVIRDIISMGTRPIALLDALRFAPIASHKERYSQQSKWLFKNAVRGIAYYGNCIGIPTVGGEIEFDQSFEDYCLIDVASVGLGRKEDIIANHVGHNDYIILVGGPTGQDGIHGASFASKTLKVHTRSAVQIPDPFMEKLLMEATIEAVKQRCVKALKDLGGGGLSCCLSELSNNLNVGFDIDLNKIHVKQNDMSPSELMNSESQERMLFITDKTRIVKFFAILDKYDIGYSIIGTVKNHHDLVIRFNGKIVARMPSQVVASAPAASRNFKHPMYLDKLNEYFVPPRKPTSLNKILPIMISNPSIASKQWIYNQYDHEVGVRTVIKPGCGDASVLKLDNGKFISLKLDGNSKHCYLDPYQGTLGCLSEACRNLVCTGAEPIGVIDHLQFGDPGNPEVFWTFRQVVNAIRDYCGLRNLPVIGGKVSFYNETLKGHIKPSPVIGALGLIENEKNILQSALRPEDSLFMIGSTNDELGGSEYYEYYHNVTGGNVPKLNFAIDKMNSEAALLLIRDELVDCIHDCSKGGLGIAIAEMAIQGKIGFEVEVDKIPNSCFRLDNLLFSESHSRYIFGTRERAKVKKALCNIKGLVFSEIGVATKEDENAVFITKAKKIIDIPIQKLRDKYNSLEQEMFNMYH